MNCPINYNKKLLDETGLVEQHKLRGKPDKIYAKPHRNIHAVDVDESQLNQLLEDYKGNLLS
ncbi:MAG: hypothetical protein MHMPM18_002599 [Marteilia pararefringens]